MAGNFNLPTLTESYRSDFLDQIRDNEAVLATMFDGSIAYSNQPTGAVKFASGVFQRWGGSTWATQPVALGGGGTGATTAAGARTALSVYSQAEIDALADSFNTTKADKTITISASNGLSGGGSLSANRTISGVDATTSAKGVVQLNNTVTSTSTTQAATANAVKTAYNKVTISSATYTLGGGFTNSNDINISRSADVVTITAAKSITHGSAYVVISSQIVPTAVRPTRAVSASFVEPVSGKILTVTIGVDGYIIFKYCNFSGEPINVTIAPIEFTIAYSRF